LYLNPPNKALVLRVDEKAQIQALDRIQLVLPLRPWIPARCTQDYIRPDTTTLFAALSVLEGTVIGACLHQAAAQQPTWRWKSKRDFSWSSWRRIQVNTQLI
jgi:hypothetical protein